ncbi:MAG: hypothetical protein WKF84_11110 [Pyrinomonadaceae bacterium]
MSSAASLGTESYLSPVNFSINTGPISDAAIITPQTIIPTTASRFFKSRRHARLQSQVPPPEASALPALSARNESSLAATEVYLLVSDLPSVC